LAGAAFFAVAMIEIIKISIKIKFFLLCTIVFEICYPLSFQQFFQENFSLRPPCPQSKTCWLICINARYTFLVYTDWPKLFDKVKPKDVASHYFLRSQG
jgi:hypothetical protein